MSWLSMVIRPVLGVGVIDRSVECQMVGFYRATWMQVSFIYGARRDMHAYVLEKC